MNENHIKIDSSKESNNEKSNDEKSNDEKSDYVLLKENYQLEECVNNINTTVSTANDANNIVSTSTSASQNKRYSQTLASRYTRKKYNDEKELQEQQITLEESKAKADNEVSSV